MYRNRTVAGVFQFLLFTSKPSPHFDHAITKNRGVPSMITLNTVFQWILASKMAFVPSHPALQVAEFTQPTRAGHPPWILSPTYDPPRFSF